jgi:hypothetical protein
VSASCPRCGAALASLADLADCVTDAGSLATRASVALEARKLVVPSTVALGLRGLSNELPRIARAIACHAGTCLALASDHPEAPISSPMEAKSP